ncbi:hypothetical protein Celal_1521 [Cellulophaga algicola DSM 14237]|uniref:Uncharacterized protein n=1 Tax=Cellulophaga algicola (strain DSM 14237 / IC166 / ACAM 630) TaxID=688270 RepID=E6XAD3_CELAD|nr:biopolymer transporter ExbD [Cellulophaga algicola]ADV48832.1 hypothetical protein Celal_1521 [Cellulophaga algicola DSM 14237]
MRNTFFIFFILFGIVIHGQNKISENVLMECIYRNYPDHGVALKQLILDFEDKLLQEKVIADFSGSSYRRVINQMAKDTFLTNQFFFNFSDEWEKVANSFDRINKNCRNTILKENSLPFELKVSDLISKKNRQSSSDIAQIMLQIFSDKDLELEYIKLNLFLFMATSATTNIDGSDKLLPPISYSENAFQIEINSHNEIYYADTVVSINELSELLKAYLLKNTSNATILISYSENTTYGDYIKLQQAVVRSIVALKQEYALDIYDLSYDALKIGDKDKVDLMYPLNSIETEVKNH